MTPKNKPQISREDVEKILKAKRLSFNKHAVILLGIRGYYLSMGKEGTNDRRIYDDAAIWITEDSFETFNFNTDPNGTRPGWGTHSNKGMAVLKEGNWLYIKGRHKTYAAFRQGEAVIVNRDKKGGGSYEERGWFGINIHRGGNTSTSSLGCQTIPANQWADFKTHGYAEVTRKNVSNFMYCLITEEEVREILGPVTVNKTEVVKPKKETHTLRLKDEGAKVRALQTGLNEWVLNSVKFETKYAGIGPIVVDGIFGTFTENRVMLFQRWNMLVEDGIVGPKTIAALIKFKL